MRGEGSAAEVQAFLPRWEEGVRGEPGGSGDKDQAVSQLSGARISRIEAVLPGSKGSGRGGGGGVPPGGGYRIKDWQSAARISYGTFLAGAELRGLQCTWHERGVATAVYEAL